LYLIVNLDGTPAVEVLGLSHRPDAKTTKLASVQLCVKSTTAAPVPVLDFSVLGRAKNKFDYF
jgi:hypothetical protein